jgi:hypothetical protein
MNDPKRPHAVPEWNIALDPVSGNVLLSLAHAPTPEEYLAGRMAWAYLIMTPQQAKALGVSLIEVELSSPQLDGEEI